MSASWSNSFIRLCHQPELIQRRRPLCSQLPPQVTSWKKKTKETNKKNHKMLPDAACTSHKTAPLCATTSRSFFPLSELQKFRSSMESCSQITLKHCTSLLKMIKADTVAPVIISAYCLKTVGNKI